MIAATPSAAQLAARRRPAFLPPLASRLPLGPVVVDTLTGAHRRLAWRHLATVARSLPRSSSSVVSAAHGAIIATSPAPDVAGAGIRALLLAATKG